MRSLTTVIVLSTAVLSGRRPAESPVCSRMTFAVGRDTVTTFFVGRALPDTVLTGPGTVRFEATSGHWGSGNARPIYGQIIAIDQLGGAGARALEAAFVRAGARRVVVVPWDYDAACQPVPWSGSRKWVETTEPGFYRVRLRPESLWVDGRPVLDAFTADLDPYPHGLFFQRGYGGTDVLRRGPALSAAEYFAFHSALPEWGEAARDRAAAAQALAAWELAHPEIAQKYPAPAILRTTRSMMKLP